MWRLRRLRQVIYSLIVLAISIVGSLAIHLPLKATREVGRDVLLAFVNPEMRGELEVDEIESIDGLNLDEIVVRGVRLRDPEGRVVIDAERVVVGIDLPALEHGELRFRYGHVTGGALTLIDDGEGMPSFLHAFEAADPSDEPPSEDDLLVTVSEIRLEEFVAQGEVLGLQDLRVENMSVRGFLEIDTRKEHPVDVQIWSATGDVVSPFPFDAQIEAANARIRDDPQFGSEVWADIRSGDERARANLTFRAPEGSDVQEMDLLIAADPVRAETVAAAGFDWASTFSGLITGHVRLFGPPDSLALQAQLDTEGGRVRLRGELPTEGDVAIVARTEALEVARVLPGAPEDLRVAGEIVFTANEENVLEAQLEPFEYQGLSIPATQARVRLEDEQAVIEAIELTPRGGGALQVSGTASYDGSFDLQVSGQIRSAQREPNLQRFVPGAQGSVLLSADVRISPELDLDIHGRYVIENARYSIFRARRVLAAGLVHGSADAPIIDFDVEVDEAFLSDIAMGNGSAHVQGGPRRYTATTNFQSSERQISMDLNARIGQGVAIDVPRASVRSGSEHWNATVSGLYIEGPVIEVASLLVRSGPQRLTASGRWQQQRNGLDEVHLDATNLQIASVRNLIGQSFLPDVAGRISGTARIGGDLETQPTLDVDFSLDEGRVLDVTSLSASVLGRYEEGQLSLDAGVAIAGLGSVDMNLTGELDTHTRLRDAYLDGAYETRLSLQGIDLSQLGLLRIEDVPPLSGEVSGEIQISGALDFFDVHGELEVPALRYADFPALSVTNRFGYESGALVARVIAADEIGDLIEVELSALLDITTLIESPELLWPVLQASPWRVAAMAPARRLSDWPQPIADQIPMADSLVGSASFSIHGGAYQPHADLFATVLQIGTADLETCGQGSRPRMDIEGQFDQGVATILSRGFLAGNQILRAEANAELPFEAWLAGDLTPGLPPFSLLAEVMPTPLHEIPSVCEYVSGNVQGTIEMDDIFGPNTRAQVRLRSDDARARRLGLLDRGRTREVATLAQTPESQTRINLDLQDGELTIDTLLAWWNTGQTRVLGTMPIAWSDQQPVPDVGVGELNAEVTMHDAPVAPFLMWLGSLTDLRGGLFGHVHASGDVRNPSLVGELALRDGRLDIASIGQRLEDVEARLIFEERNITLQGLRANDGDGWVSAAGELAIDGIRPEQLQLDIQAAEFPVRQEGSPLGFLTGNAQVVSDFEEDTLRSQVSVNSMVVRIPEEFARDTQDLSDHSDVCVIGQSCDRDVIRERPYALSFAVRSASPIRVKSEELAADLMLNLDATYADPDLTLVGEVQILSGTFQTLGKVFQVERGAILFDEEHPLDPEVNLVARYMLANNTESVTITASGRLSEPVIHFASTITSDRAEIIGLLISGDVRGEQSAEAEGGPEDFLATIAGGVLSPAIRAELSPELRAVIPRIIVEPRAGGGQRFGGGWRLEELLPESVRRIVQSVYLEGFVVRGGNGNSRRTLGTDYGFLLELAFPRNIVNTNSYSPPNNFSLDITWQP